MTTMTQDRLAVWTVYLGNGNVSHAAAEESSDRTLCGRSTATAAEWRPPGDQPGCELCFRKLALK